MVAQLNNDREAVSLVTGGFPGATGNEFYMFNDVAFSTFYIEFYDGYYVGGGISSQLPPQDIQICNVGSQLTNGIGWASLPVHTIALNSPSTAAPYYIASSGVTAYPIISQCESPIPSNRARTTIGVGELVDLYFNQTLPGNPTWSTTAGTLSSTNSPRITFTAPANAGAATITCKVLGQTSRITFNVVAPSGELTAEIVGTNHYPVGWVGAGMTDLVIVYPTNVCFYWVEMDEITASYTNVAGYCTNLNLNPVIIGSSWLSYSNTYQDDVVSHFQPSIFPLCQGSYEITTPIGWHVYGSSTTNYLETIVSLAQLVDASGDFSDAKFGIAITRSTNDVSFSTQ